MKSNHQNIVKVIKTTYSYCATGALSLNLTDSIIINCVNKNSHSDIEKFRNYIEQIGMRNPYTGLRAFEPGGGRWNGMSTGCCDGKGRSWITIHTYWNIGATKPDLEDLIYWEQ